MIVDSEIQRQQLLACIRDTHIAGTLQQVMDSVPVMQALLDAVTNAKIETPPTNEVHDAGQGQ